MSIAFLDTSAIVKRYFPEAGTAWIQRLTDTANDHTIVLSELTLAETGAAIAAKQRASGGMTTVERDAFLRRFLQHCIDEYVLVPVDRMIIDRAVLLTQQHRLRGYDALQLATALRVNEQYLRAGLPILTFVAADRDLLAAVRFAGLPTENPNEFL